MVALASICEEHDLLATIDEIYKHRVVGERACRTPDPGRCLGERALRALDAGGSL
ncbi:hypothetical protein ACMHYB_56240 [Sorangium sp. So ce1128]